MIASAVKILIFLVVNTMGSFVISLLFNGAIMIGWPFSQDINEVLQSDDFVNWMLRGGSTVWIVCALLSLFYLALDGRKRFIFLSLPIIAPLLYGIAVLIAFS